jgi:hypothetical protein
VGTIPAGVTLITAGSQTLTITDLTSGITGTTVVTLQSGSSRNAVRQRGPARARNGKP